MNESLLWNLLPEKASHVLLFPFFIQIQQRDEKTDHIQNIVSNFIKNHTFMLCVVNLLQSCFKLKQSSPNVSKILIESDADKINWCVKCKWHIATGHSNQSNPREYEKASGYFEESRSVIISSKLFVLHPVWMVLLTQ